MFVSLREILLLGGIALAGAAAVAAAASLRGSVTFRVRLPKPAAVVWFLAGAYAVVFTAAALGRHFGMATWGLDLGYYGNVIYNYGRGHFFRQTLVPSSNYFNNHLEPLLAVFGPLTYIFREPAYLLVIQTVFIASGVVLIYVLARPPAGSRWPAAALAASFALSPALHGATLYDFHSRALAVPLVLAAFIFFSRKRFGAGIICAVHLALSQDELALHAVALAAYGGYLSGRRRAGFIAAGALAGYFLIVCCILYPALTYAGPTKPPLFASIFGGFGLLLIAPFRDAVFAAKAGYVLTLLAPAAFLPAAGGALVTLITPLAMPALASTPTVFQLGWQYPLSSLPFIYGAAALAARRITKAELTRRRRFFLTFASVAAVAFQVILIVAFAGRYYARYVETAFPSAYKNSLHGLTSRIPDDIPLAADHVFTAHLAHRPYVYIYESALQVKTLAAKPAALVLERRPHALAELPAILDNASRWGLNIVECTGDYVYFGEGPAGRSAEELFRAWYGTVEEWQCAGPGNKIVADARAHDGRAMLVPRFLGFNPMPGDVYPPGKYTLAFELRLARAGDFCPAVFLATVTDAAEPSRMQTFRWDQDIGGADSYRPYYLRLESDRPFVLNFSLHTFAPVYFDAVSVNSADFTLATVRDVASYYRLPYKPPFEAFVAEMRKKERRPKAH